jgi:dTDP-4-dehydrorhamnose 3,5-epimerase
MYLEDIMHFIKTKLEGAYVIQRDLFKDERGSFGRVFCKREFEENGLCNDFVQTSLSVNSKKYTLRGLHSLKEPNSEDKLIVCTSGSIFDVCVNVRENSPTYGQYVSEILTGENGKMLYIPKGFAHGFLTLEDNTNVLYCMTEFYNAGYEVGFRYDEPRFNICWPEATELIISEKDKTWGYLK